MITYKDSGVDSTAGDKLVDIIKPLAKKTHQPSGVLSGIGSFASLFEVSKSYTDPVIVSGSDGCGTKLKLASEWNLHDTIGIDLVAMSVNDILTCGAKPVFFLDYFATSKLDVDTAEKVIKGIISGCIQSDCALLGGETSEMPGMYQNGEYDLAGFGVGLVEKSKIITGDTILPGDVMIGLKSSGVHSNGYSLVRKCIELRKNNLPQTLDSVDFKTAIMEPTRIYVKSILNLLQNSSYVKGMAHITGGGLVENIPRILPKFCDMELDYSGYKKSDLFMFLQDTAAISNAEMLKTFNCGIGFVVIVSQEDTLNCMQILQESGESCLQIGTITRKKT